MSDYPKQMLFITALSGSGRLILVEVIGPNPRINGGLYIRYPEGGTDTTYPEFLFDVPEELTRLQSEVERLRGRLVELVEYVDGPGELAGDYNWEMLKADTNTSQAWLLRKQAEAVEAAVYELAPGRYGPPDDPSPEFNAACEMCAEFSGYAHRLRQQADEAENAGG